MTPLAKIRFEALAAYCRSPMALLMGEEVAWFEFDDEKILLVVIRDAIDNDYLALFLGKNAQERFQSVGSTQCYPTIEEVIAAASVAAGRVRERMEENNVRTGRPGDAIDFFTPLVDVGKLHPHFIALTTLEGYSPALELIKPMMRWYEDADGNFVEQFQTSAFDSRLWELYLFATLVEANFVIDRSNPAPDFCCESLDGQICIEATTVNPTRNRLGEIVPPPPIESLEEFKAFQEHYMPIRYAGPLTAKLAKMYWDLEHVRGRPLVFAIQDFHAPSSMVMSRTALPIYLYGMKWESARDADGALVITPSRIDEHVWGQKIVESGFFRLPGSENISAVIANASATISKFDRIGILAGFGSTRVHIVRRGTAVDPDPNASEPLSFVHNVRSENYRESWIEGMEVFHNPNASIPLDKNFLPGASHHSLRDDGQMLSSIPAWHPFSSITEILAPKQ